MSDLTTVRCARYACNLAINTCVAKWKVGVNANPGVKGSGCAGCEQGRKRAGLGQVASGGDGDLTSVNEVSLRMQKPDQAPVVTLTTAPTHRNIALDSGLPICPNCGEEFEPNPFTTTEQIYCSHRCCKQAWAKVHRPGKKRMNMSNIKRASTPSTATSVTTDSGNVATNAATTATQPATPAANDATPATVATTTPLTCLHCSVAFQPNPNSRNKQIYCSKRCAKLAWKARVMGDRERLASEREDLREYALRLAGTIAKEQSKSYDYEKENTRLKEQSDMLVAQLTEERLTLEEENGKLQRRVERLNGDADGLRVENDRLNAALAEANESINAHLEGRIEADAEIAKLQSRVQELEAENTKLTAALAEQTEQLHTKANFWKNRCREVRDLLGVPLDTPDNEIADAMITKLTELNDIANQAKASIPKELRLVQPADKLPPVDALPIGYVAKAIMYVLTEFPNLRILPACTPGDVCGGAGSGGKGNSDPGRQVN